MNPINGQIAAKVRAGLAEQRITNEEYFLAVGFSDRTGARRLSGISRWTSDELDLTARFLGLPISELVTARTSEKASA